MAEGEIDNLTMEQYLAWTRGNQALAVVKPEIGGSVNFEIKSQFMRELREDTFFGNKNDDAHEHVERVLDIVSLFNILGVSHDVVMLRVFPVTLTGATKRWVDRLPPGTVDFWDLLKKILYPKVPCKREHEEMEIFIKEFRTTNELLLKEQSNLLSELKIKKHKEAEDLAADHLSRFENPHMEVLTEREIDDKISNEHLMVLKSKFKDDGPWYVDFVNYIVGKEEPYAFKLCANNIMRRCVAGSETIKILAHCHSGPTCGHHSASVTAKKVYESGFYWPSIFKDVNEYVRRCDACQRSGNISSRNKMPQNNIEVEAQALPTNDARVLVKFLRSLFARFGVPKALISDRGTHFCNSQLEKALQRYGVTHKLSTAYHPQSNGQTKVINRAIKRILEKSVGYNPKAELRDGAYENTRIYKEQTKKWHDSRLRGDKDFKTVYTAYPNPMDTAY
ncbi:reverse transcriptase domain-containing protein [Tanacetum coccineum]|uniref:Reverse transcriptase domain-containing protein n=1 Tax=Tanacetum coccineum TaxID=301880 RepID=A0ABQ5AKQ1_9ASTR